MKRMFPHEADYVLYWSNDLKWHVYHVRRNVETYHMHVRIVGECQTYFEDGGILLLPGKPKAVCLVKGTVKFDET